LPVIIREWRGRADPARAEAYPKHFRDNVVPELRHLPGFLGAHLARQSLDGWLEYMVLTRWLSMESIKAFAGDEIDKAVVEPGAVAALIDFDDFVRHYEVIEDVPQ
jgi:heme-degrading monooxygenase HmoA